MSNVLNCSNSQIMSPVFLHLENGLSVRLLSQPWLKQAAVCVRVHVGSHDEPLTYPGLAHFLEHLLFLGSVGYIDDQRLMPFVQACGGQVNASTQARHTEYFCEVPADCLEDALARLMDMLARPLFGESEQKREQEVVHAEFIARSQDVDTLLAAAFGQVLAEGHRCGVFQAGNRDTLPVSDPAFQLTLRDFHRTYYHAGNCQLSIVAPFALEQLKALAQRHGELLFSAQALTRRSPAPLLPLRAKQLRLNLPGSASSLHLGFAIELPDARIESALDCLLSWFQDEAPAGLSACIRERGLGGMLRGQVLYCYEGQALLLLSVLGVANPNMVVALVHDWLVFVGTHVDPVAWHDEYLRIRQQRQYSMSPLELARDCSVPLHDEGGAIRSLLQQLQEAQRRCVLLADLRELPTWLGAGFTLNMRAEPVLSAPVLRGNWQLPARNPLLGPDDFLAKKLAVPAALRWLQAPGYVEATEVSIAVWQARCCFDEPLGTKVLLKFAQGSLLAVRQHLQQVGIKLSLDAESANLIVRMQGNAKLMPDAIVLLMSALLKTHADQWSKVIVAELPSMPIRQLLAASAELLQMPVVRKSEEDVAKVLQRFRKVRVEAQGVGIDRVGQARIESLFHTREPWLSSPVAPVQPGLHWRTLEVQGESALLLFCPQLGKTALAEATWRLLAHLHQRAFYQRLRSDLQLGYAVFCSYRQIQGRRGLLFGVQSSRCNAAEILEHIKAFLHERGAWLTGMDQSDLTAALTSLRHQWQAQANSVDGIADLAWLAHLAGLSPDHGDAMQQSLHQLSLESVQKAHKALLQTSAGWYVLSNELVPAHP